MERAAQALRELLRILWIEEDAPAREHFGQRALARRDARRAACSRFHSGQAEALFVGR